MESSASSVWFGMLCLMAGIVAVMMMFKSIVLGNEPLLFVLGLLAFSIAMMGRVLQMFFSGRF